MGIFSSFWKKNVDISKVDAQPGDNAVTPQSPLFSLQPYNLHDRIAGRYEIRRILGGPGKSGMGIVYVCYDHEEKMVVALKTFQDEYLTSKKAQDSFKKEALLWVMLDRHPYIVRAFLVQELDCRLFVVCEFVAPDDEERNTLTHYLRQPISLKQALIWSIQFCYGMEYAVSKGVSPHRDIKPDNILITKDGMLKITDFGLAGMWQGEGVADDLRDVVGGEQKGFTFLKQEGGKVRCGTPPWMAPEQFDGEADVRSDLYSFGIVLYQMAQDGNLPIRPQGSDHWEIAHKTYPVRFNRALSGADERKSLFPLIEKCLEKDPGRRYTAFRDLRSDLEDVYEEEITRKTGEKLPSQPEMTELEAWELSNKGVSLDNVDLHDEAIRTYQEAIRIRPKLAEAHNNLGIALKAKGNLDGAIKKYGEALEIRPEFAEAHFNLGIALAAKGDLDGAIEEFRAAIRIRPTLTIRPTYAVAHYNLGNALQAKGNLDGAIEEYREALRIRPEFADAHCILGIALYNKGDLDGAIREFLEALSIRPDFAEAHYNLGLALGAKGDLDGAIEKYREALKIRPNQAEAHYNLGIALAAKGDLDGAIEEYREALRIRPEYADAHYNLGNALESRGDLDGAIRAFEDFIRYAPRQYAGDVEKTKQAIAELKKRT